MGETDGEHQADEEAEERHESVPAHVPAAPEDSLHQHEHGEQGQEHSDHLQIGGADREEVGNRHVRVGDEKADYLYGGAINV